MAVGIVEGDRVVHLASFGHGISPATPLVLASVSKPLTATAVLQLVDEGRVDLDSPVVAYVALPPNSSNATPLARPTRHPRRRQGIDIDHLVIGPGGVYTINAKHHPGANMWVGGDTLLINGQAQSYIRNSRHEANRASRLLTAASGFPVFAAGAVVLVAAQQITIKKPPPDVRIIGRKELTRWLRRHSAPTVGTPR